MICPHMEQYAATKSGKCYNIDKCYNMDENFVLSEKVRCKESLL